MKLGFWLQWAGRDLRQRWLQVSAIALIIALGAGLYGGLGGQESWRLASTDKSYQMLNMYDLRLRLTQGSWLPQDRAIQVLSQAAGVQAVEPRLLLDTQVKVLGSEADILVMGQIMGVETRAGGPHVNRVYIEEGGRGLTEADTHQAILEYKFARHYGLEVGVRLMLSAGLEADVVGLGQIPDHFMVMPAGEFGFFLGEASFAAVVLPLATVQDLFQHSGQINEVLFLLEEQADPQAVQIALEALMRESFSGVGYTILTPQDDPAYNLLYHDPVEDQGMLDFFAIILLAGASLAAFNLAGRIVESQRRQIGISMALGVPRRLIAIRPLLMGLKIAILGTLIGLGLALLFAWVLGDLTMEMLPLPYWSGTMLHLPSMLTAGLLGILLPLLATLIPVWQAVRMPPLEAIHGHLIARSSGLNRWLKGVRLPGNTFNQMPLKNALRSVRRSGLMSLGIVTAVILLTLFLGLLDTLLGTIEQAEKAYLHRSPDRLVVNLTNFFPVDHPQVDRIASLESEDGRPLFAEVEKGLMLIGRLRAEGATADEAIFTTLETFDPYSPIWRPNLDSTDNQIHIAPGETGLVISRKMADDLGMEVGGTVILEHPLQEGLMEVRLVERSVTIAGIHDNPIRTLSYIDRTQEPFTGLEMATNLMTVVPAAGVQPEAARRALFAEQGVASVQTMVEIVDVFDEAVELLTAVLRVIQDVVLLLAFLIAYNATSINIDDRIREIATMFAFGLRPRTVLLVQIGENLLLGLIGTIIGLVVGYLMLRQFMAARMENMFENIGLLVIVAPLTMLMIVLASVGVVALTPLVNFRRLRRLNIPNTLRVME
jgi:putative ABC transport system permease protein